MTIERQANEIRLRIRNLTTEDQGTWECLGSDNSGRQSRRSFQLTVKGLFIIFRRNLIEFCLLSSTDNISW